jgi:hypothetical protein
VACRQRVLAGPSVRCSAVWQSALRRQRTTSLALRSTCLRPRRALHQPVRRRLPVADPCPGRWRSIDFCQALLRVEHPPATPCHPHKRPSRRSRSRRPCINPVPTDGPIGRGPPTRCALGGLAIGRHPAWRGGSIKPIGGLIVATHAESRGVSCPDEDPRHVVPWRAAGMARSNEKSSRWSQSRTRIPVRASAVEADGELSTSLLWKESSAERGRRAEAVGDSLATTVVDKPCQKLLPRWPALPPFTSIVSLT